MLRTETGELYRQKEANKNAIVFVSSWKSFWEAGILPAELLPLVDLVQVSQNQSIQDNSNFRESGNPDSTTGIDATLFSITLLRMDWASV
jgi:hypothetical protein